LAVPAAGFAVPPAGFAVPASDLAAAALAPSFPPDGCGLPVAAGRFVACDPGVCGGGAVARGLWALFSGDGASGAAALERCCGRCSRSLKSKGPESESQPSQRFNSASIAQSSPPENPKAVRQKR
jgi:hypothetical protein